MRTPIVMVGFLFLMAAPLRAQDRDAKVRGDREAFRDSSSWIYNDLDRGIRAAKEAGKPLLVVFRCIPCEACHEFDDEVAQRDPIIRDLLDEFTCVRIVQANVIDLSRFHFDFDQSFAIVLMNADGTIYGRFGTRSARPEWDDISLQGLRKAMAEALRMHRDYGRVKPSLAGKQVKPSRYRTPLDYPSLSARYQEKLDYEGQVARSCIHCHQIRDAERRVYRSSGEPMPDEVLYPYPDPEVLGLSMDPKEMATVVRVAPGSIADRAGLKPHDAIASLAGQPLLSIADLQWVLHNAPATAQLKAQVLRDGGTKELSLDLPDGWRHGDISWRTTSWELRRMALGGMRLDDLADDQREGTGVPRDGMALRVRYVAEFGDHAVAKKAGFRKGDLIVSFDGQERRMTESDLFAYALQRKRPGDAVDVAVHRDGERVTLRLTLQ